jgi:hypothetical protein
LLKVREKLGPWDKTQAGIKVDKGFPELGQILYRIKDAGKLRALNELSPQLLNGVWAR